MRTGWSLKHAGAVLDVHEKRVTQALDPALIKIALLMRVNALATHEAIMDQMSRLPPMTQLEQQIQLEMQRIPLRS